MGIMLVQVSSSLGIKLLSSHVTGDGFRFTQTSYSNLHSVIPYVASLTFPTALSSQWAPAILTSSLFLNILGMLHVPSSGYMLFLLFLVFFFFHLSSADLFTQQSAYISVSTILEFCSIVTFSLNPPLTTSINFLLLCLILTSSLYTYFFSIYFHFFLLTEILAL